jgi:hypothetical protein
MGKVIDGAVIKMTVSLIIKRFWFLSMSVLSELFKFLLYIRFSNLYYKFQIICLKKYIVISMRRKFIATELWIVLYQISMFYYNFFYINMWDESINLLPLWSSGQISRLHIHRCGFDSRCYQTVAHLHINRFKASCVSREQDLQANSLRLNITTKKVH